MASPPPRDVATAAAACRRSLQNVPFAAALLLAALVLGAHAGTAQAAFSALWGENGELWNGKGPLGGQLFDWSFAGEWSRMAASLPRSARGQPNPCALLRLYRCLMCSERAYRNLTAGPGCRFGKWPTQDVASPPPPPCPPARHSAGYKQGNEPLPSPPITRSIMEFDDGSMNDTAILKAALDWANSQPLTDGNDAVEAAAAAASSPPNDNSAWVL